MDEQKFDRLVKSMTEDLASRRVAVKRLLVVAAAAGPVVGNDFDGLAKRRRKRQHKKQKPLRCSGDSCDGTGGKRCGGRDDCQCYRAAKGGNVCASSRQSSLDDTCQTNKDCSRGYVCVEGGPACGGSGVRFCKKACYK
jgi:hypothetical protein